MDQLKTDKQKILESDGFIKFRKVIVIGQEFLIDQIFEDEEFQRIYLELGSYRMITAKRKQGTIFQTFRLFHSYLL